MRRGWVTEDDNPTEFTTDEVLRFPYPIDGYPEPRSTMITFAMGVTIDVEIMDTLSAEEIQKIDNEWQAVWSQSGYYPDTDEEAVHETMKNLGIQQYRILEDHLVSY